MMPYVYFESVPSLMMTETDILCSQRSVLRIFEEIPFVAATSVTRITPLVRSDDSGMRVYKMNYEHFAHTAAEMIRKYASKLLD